MLELTPLTATSPLDGRYANATAALREHFSEYALIKARVEVEIQWLLHLSELGQLPELKKINNLQFLQNVIENFSCKDAEKIKQTEATINHDVKAVEYFIKDQMDTLAELKPLKEFVHFGLTSEDVNNLAYGLMTKAGLNAVLRPALDELSAALSAKAHEYAGAAMLSRTHGQTASPTTMGKEFSNFYSRLERQVNILDSINILGKLNGAVGNYNALHAAYPDVNWPAVCQDFVETRLGLSFNTHTTQIENHDGVAELSHALARINTLLLDFGQDVWTYISRGYFSLKKKAEEVGSSTMPHKVNPIDFENAEGNLGLANALLNFFAHKLPVSRLQRDLSDSTVMRNLGSAFGYCLLAYKSLLRGTGKLELNTAVLEQELDQHWEVLAEPIQMILRKHGVEAPYEQLKALTRGNTVTQSELHAFIDQLSIDDAIKQTLKALTPKTYTGYAETLAKGQ